MGIQKKRMSFINLSVAVCFLSLLAILGCGGGGGGGGLRTFDYTTSGPPTSPTTPTGPTKAVPDITETLSITLSADARGKYMSTASFTFKETGGAFGYTVTSFQIIYRDQNGAAIGNPQTWDALNIGFALGNGGRIEVGGTKSNWPVVLYWNPPLTALRTDWQATVRDDTGVIMTLQGSQSANMPAEKNKYPPAEPPYFSLVTLELRDH